MRANCGCSKLAFFSQNGQHAKQMNLQTSDCNIQGIFRFMFKVFEFEFGMNNGLESIIMGRSYHTFMKGFITLAWCLAPAKLFGLALTQAKWLLQNPIIFCLSVQAVQIATRKKMEPTKRAWNKNANDCKKLQTAQMTVILCFWVDTLQLGRYRNFV